jgi:virulence factor Mce-like protein
MKRALGIAAVLAALVAVVALATGAGQNPDKGKYWVEFDNAFGLIQGGDLKIAGVRAGTITDIKLDQRTKHALIGFKITQNGFGSLRTDVHCESRPQSLIGEYFIDCLPGTAGRELKPGTTIPVTHTASTVAPDLVNNILRRPYNERLSIILSSLGAGVAGNAEALNAAVRRASPALRETDKTLAILARQNQILGDLAQNADRVIGDLNNNRKDVGRWIVEARNTATASAQRRNDIAAGFKRLPGFLTQLQPAMKALGDVADQQTPALRNLDASSKDLTTFFNRLAPFSDASRPAIRSLGNASATGDRALKAAVPTVNELNRFSQGTPELAKNLAIVLQHLDDRKYSVENDPRSPGGQGYTGLEALLTYVYDQTLSTNVFDQNNHILKLALIAGGNCVKYADVARAKKFAAECASALGPSQPGINFPDTTEFQKMDPQARAVQRRIDGDRQTPQANTPAPGPVDQAPSQSSAPQQDGKPPVQVPVQPPSQLPPLPSVPGVPPVQLPKTLPGVTNQDTPRGGGLVGGLGLKASTRSTDPQAQARLLDYLLAP